MNFISISTLFIIKNTKWTTFWFNLFPTLVWNEYEMVKVSCWHRSAYYHMRHTLRLQFRMRNVKMWRSHTTHAHTRSTLSRIDWMGCAAHTHTMKAHAHHPCHWHARMCWCVRHYSGRPNVRICRSFYPSRAGFYANERRTAPKNRHSFSWNLAG